MQINLRLVESCIVLGELNCYWALWNESLLPNFRALCCPIDFHVFIDFYCFCYKYFISSWDQTGILQYKWIPKLVRVLSVPITNISTLLLLFQEAVWSALRSFLTNQISELPQHGLQLTNSCFLNSWQSCFSLRNFSSSSRTTALLLFSRALNALLASSCRQFTCCCSLAFCCWQDSNSDLTSTTREDSCSCKANIWKTVLNEWTIYCHTCITRSHSNQ